jgi:hypothetical protein
MNEYRSLKENFLKNNWDHFSRVQSFLSFIGAFKGAHVFHGAQAGPHFYRTTFLMKKDLTSIKLQNKTGFEAFSNYLQMQL